MGEKEILDLGEFSQPFQMAGDLISGILTLHFPGVRASSCHIIFRMVSGYDHEWQQVDRMDLAFFQMFQDFLKRRVSFHSSYVDMRVA